MLYYVYITLYLVRSLWLGQMALAPGLSYPGSDSTIGIVPLSINLLHKITDQPLVLIACVTLLGQTWMLKFDTGPSGANLDQR